MRTAAIAIALVLVAGFGIIVPSAVAATGDPKVVIIVGATSIENLTVLANSLG